MQATTPDTESQDRRRQQIREAKARHDAEMAQLTRLEQAAFKERKHLGDDHDPYTGQERKEAEAIRRMISEIEARADALHRRIVKRLETQGESDPTRKALLDRFVSSRKVGANLEPF